MQTIERDLPEAEGSNTTHSPVPTSRDIIVRHMMKRIWWSRLWCQTNRAALGPDTLSLDDDEVQQESDPVELEAAVSEVLRIEAEAERTGIVIPLARACEGMSDEEIALLAIVIRASLVPDFGIAPLIVEDKPRISRESAVLKAGQAARMIYGARVDSLNRLHWLLRPGGRIRRLGVSIENRGDSVTDFANANVEVPLWLSRSLLGDPAHLEAPPPEDKPLVLPEGQWERIERIVDGYTQNRVSLGGRALAFLLTGHPGTGKTSLAWKIARRLGRPVFFHRTLADRFGSPFDRGEGCLATAFEEAKNYRGTLLFDEAGLNGRPWSSDGTLLTLLDSYDVPVIFTMSTGCEDEALDRRCLVRLHFEAPHAELRERIWTAHLERVQTDTAVSIPQLAKDYPLTGGLISNVVTEARLMADIEASPTVTEAHLTAAARHQLTQNGSKRESRSIVPTARLSDLVLGPSTRDGLERLARVLRRRESCATQLRAGGHSLAGSGVTALLSGPSGTGKTHAAEALANDAGLRFVCVRWSDFRNPFVGATERRINEFFDHLDGGTLYLIDEAEGLLSRRANAMHSWELSFIDVLLARIEQASGAVVFVTNLPEQIDEAFERRMLFRIQFQAPGPDERARILSHALTLQNIVVGEQAVRAVAARIPFTGGQIASALRRSLAISLSEDRAITLDDIEAELESERSARVGVLRRAPGFAS